MNAERADAAEDAANAAAADDAEEEDDAAAITAAANTLAGRDDGDAPALAALGRAARAAARGARVNLSG